MGCVFPNSVCQKGDIVYFFGTDQEGDTDIYIINQFTLSPLGNEYIKSLLRDLDTPIHQNPYTSDPELFRQTLAAYTTPDGGTSLLMTIDGKTYNYSINSGHIAKWYPGVSAGYNLLLQSEDFSTSWTGTNSPTITTDSTADPNGETTADTIEDDSASNESIFQTVTGIDITDTYTFSLFILKDSTGRATRYPAISLRFYTGGSSETNVLRIDTSALGS